MKLAVNLLVLCCKNIEALIGSIAFDQCDMYVTTEEGALLIVGCHEDDVINGERFVWVPAVSTK